MFLKVVQIAQIKRNDAMKLLKFQRDVANILGNEKEPDNKKIEDIRECLNTYIVDNIYKIPSNLYSVELSD